MNWQEFYDYLMEEVDPEKYHNALDKESWFYQDQKRRYDDDVRKGRKIEYRIDPKRDAEEAKKRAKKNKSK